MSQANEPAFPLQDATVSRINASAGLTKRELFAAMAMQGFCANEAYIDTGFVELAAYSVSQADALIRRLNESPVTSAH